MNIAWLYNKSLNKCVGGTERATILAIEMIKLLGHNSFANIIIDEKGLFFEDTPIDDLYQFLKSKKIDIVINQIGYSKVLLKSFLERGGGKWRQEGGKIVTYMHFDPKMMRDLDYFLSLKDKRIKDYLIICKLYLLKQYYSKKERNIYADIYRYLYNESDKYVTLSPTHFPYLKSLLQLETYNKLYAINNTLTFPDISSPEILDYKDKTVLLVARLSEVHKKISVALKVWKNISRKSKYLDWTFKIVGDGQDMQRYKDYVKKNRVERVSFEGEKNPEPYYSKASLFLMTSPSEGWGLTITECLQRGVVPVIMNTSPVFSEIVVNNKCGILVENYNIEEFQNAVEKLMDDAALRSTMAVNALKRAELFSKENTLKKWKELIENIYS
ncbi:MAG: glycosyltransferase [Bacteroidaceae bacterium]|nr:glycosyltransferase [Bacteroidaceae bacterium]